MKIMSRTEIIARCREAKQENLLDAQPYGNKIMKLCEHRVVKFGKFIFEKEARNQSVAHALLDRRIVRVPEVYDFFQDDESCGYLVMELMTGEKSSTITEKSQLEALSVVLQHFTTHKSPKPGPLSGGTSQALVFGELDFPSFESGQHLDEWFSHRLLEPTKSICLSQFDFVLCHLDLFPRNILWQEHGPPAILDWASAGYYPQVLERCTYQTIGLGEDQQLFGSIDPAEEEQMKLVLRAWRNIMRFSFTRPVYKTPDIEIDPDFVIPEHPIPSFMPTNNKPEHDEAS